MNIRKKGEKVRITFADTDKPQNVQYVTVDAQTCWSATFNAWGKRMDAPLATIGGKTFKVVLEEVA